jgi:oxygen-independent coproporphyrinogen-3 oxidase
LADLGVFRLHFGVQTLSDPLRDLLGRRETASEAFRKIQPFLSDPRFVCSVDLLYGIPGQTAEDFLGDIRTLSESGADGFAFYGLNFSGALRRHMETHRMTECDPIEKFRMYFLGRAEIRSKGYAERFFSHFGNSRDLNLYSTYPARNEYGLAFGARADGRIGRLHFRHLPLKRYLDAVNDGRLGVEWAYLEDGSRAFISDLETGLMSTFVPESALSRAKETAGASLEGIVDLWRHSGLVEKENGGFRLTFSGCYLLADMMRQVRRLHGSSGTIPPHHIP